MNLLTWILSALGVVLVLSGLVLAAGALLDRKWGGDQ